MIPPRFISFTKKKDPYSGMPTWHEGPEPYQARSRSMLDRTDQRGAPTMGGVATEPLTLQRSVTAPSDLLGYVDLVEPPVFRRATTLDSLASRQSAAPVAPQRKRSMGNAIWDSNKGADDMHFRNLGGTQPSQDCRDLIPPKPLRRSSQDFHTSGGAASCMPSKPRRRPSLLQRSCSSGAA